MAAHYTTLANAALVGDQTIVVTSATGAAIGQVYVVDGEQMVQVADAINTTTIPVRRGGQGGSIQRAHAILASVVIGAPNEIVGTQPSGSGTVLQPFKQEIVSYGADATIVSPVTDTLIFLNKATTGAFTLGDCVVGTVDGVRVTIVSTTTGAHVITNATGFYGTGTASDTATFAAAKNESISLISCKGLWAVTALAGVTIG
jgi:hypothetical protein